MATLEVKITPSAREFIREKGDSVLLVETANSKRG
jgi:hypothetical protein